MSTPVFQRIYIEFKDSTSEITDLSVTSWISQYNLPSFGEIWQSIIPENRLSYATTVEKPSFCIVTLNLLLVPGTLGRGSRG